MNLPDDDLCYQALKSRDRRFEGCFFVAVTSTRIYCRPGCPARTPLRRNVRFVPTAAAAEAQGFRACRRCRPDASPGTDAWLLHSAVVSRALRAIHEGALDEGSVEALAARCGVGGRHLSRLFQEQLGASPVAIAQTRRTHFARRLLEQTRLPMIQVAFSSGFASVRRFNTAMRQTFDHTPTELRKGRGPRRTEDLLRLRLPYRPPLDWNGLLAFLGPRCIPGVESLSDGVYRRRVHAECGHGILELQAVSGRDLVEVRLPSHLSPILQDLLERVQRLLDLRADPRVIEEALGGDPRLGDAVRAGVRVPGAFDGFELAVRAVLGQQVTVTGATTLAGRLVQRSGRCLDADSDLAWVFPRAEDLAGEDLEGLGMPRLRGRAIQQMAAEVAAGRLDLSPSADPEEVFERLCRVPGIGRWTASYICLRALGHPDAFPGSDLGLRKAVSAHSKPITEQRLLAMAEAWRPWRAYAAMALWDGLRTNRSHQ